jgi:hypothetical protein
MAFYGNPALNPRLTTYPPYQPAAWEIKAAQQTDLSRAQSRATTEDGCHCGCFEVISCHVCGEVLHCLDEREVDEALEQCADHR